MNNKDYIDKVIDYMVRRTNIDYENELVDLPFPFHTTHYNLLYLLSNQLTESSFYHSFNNYCVNTFGLTSDEVRYVWDEYKNIIKDKIRK